MKRKKNILALVLALMMAFSLLAVPAAASMPDEEDVMPLSLEMDCPKCGTPMDRIRIQNYSPASFNFECPYGHCSIGPFPYTY